MAKKLVKNLVKNPDELEMNSLNIWSKAWFTGRIRNDPWVGLFGPLAFKRAFEGLLKDV